MGDEDKTPPAPAAPIEKLLDLLERLWRERRQPDGLFRRLLRWIRWGLVFLTAAYILCLIGILLALEYIGERHLTLAYLLYLPPQGWLLPLAVLVPVCLLFHPKLSLFYLIPVILVFWFYMDFEWSSWREPEGRHFKILVNNIGQNNRKSLTPFIEEQMPDVIALQEAGRQRQYSEAYPDRHVRAEKEFTLISRFEIVGSSLVTNALWEGHPVAARFEIDFEGERVAVYNIHMPSPRPELTKLSGRGMLIGFAPNAGRLGETRQRMQKSWSDRIRLARELAEVFRNEPLPHLAVGDFNMPAHGHIYHTFTDALHDSFEQAGRGYGYTFPGTTRNPLTLFGPWLRIDYVFASGHFQAVYCRAEPDRKSQHRAVVATLELNEPSE